MKVSASDSRHGRDGPPIWALLTLIKHMVELTPWPNLHLHLHEGDDDSHLRLLRYYSQGLRTSLISGFIQWLHPVANIGSRNPASIMLRQNADPNIFIGMVWGGVLLVCISSRAGGLRQEHARTSPLSRISMAAYRSSDQSRSGLMDYIGQLLT